MNKIRRQIVIEKRKVDKTFLAKTQRRKENQLGFSLRLGAFARKTLLDREIPGLKLLFDERQEALGISAVDHAMIEAESEICHPANADKVVSIRSGEYLGPLLNLTNAENRELRLIDNRCAE